MNVRRVIGAALLIWVATMVFRWLTCGWLFTWVYDIPPNIWKKPEEMITVGNIIGVNLSNLVQAFLFAIVFAIIYKGVPGKGVGKGIIYGFFVWLLSGFSGVVSMPFYMIVAVPVVVYWIVQVLVLDIINGAIVGWIIQDQK